MRNTTRISTFLIFIFGFTMFVGSTFAGEYTDVIDAFDKENKDPFDINIGIGYEHRASSGKITRETTDSSIPIHQWDYYASHTVTKYKHSQNLLNIDLEMGLFRDLAFRLGIPIILSDDRQLTGSSGSWLDGEVYGPEDLRLFSTQLKSPQRSGLDYIATGLWWGILDQGRTKEYPNWTIFVEGRFGVGSPLTAACANASDDTANNCDPGADGGISRDLNELRLGMQFSRRYGKIEPYMGIDALLGWPKGKNLDPSSNAGALNDLPPLKGTFDFGLEIIPWEVPKDHRKLVITVGGGATYYSEGRTYTPLFDALGTSAYFAENADLNDSGITGDISEEDQALLEWNGMTDIENYAAFFGKLAVTIQPAKYVKFNVGYLMGHETEHFITKTDQCPAGQVVNGVCQNYNLGHRPEIDKPGTRFRAEKTFTWSLFVDAVAQF